MDCKYVNRSFSEGIRPNRNFSKRIHPSRRFLGKICLQEFAQVVEGICIEPSRRVAPDNLLADRSVPFPFELSFDFLLFAEIN